MKEKTKKQLNPNNFILFKDVEKVIHDNDFYGFTAKRNEDRTKVLYTYHSVKWPNILISVLTMKLNPQEIPSTKIVLGIKFNDEKVETWNDFIAYLKHQHLREVNKKVKLTNEEIFKMARQI